MIERQRSRTLRNPRGLRRGRRLRWSLPIAVGLAAAGAALARHLLRRRRPATEGTETVGPAYGETSTRPGAHTFSLHATADGERRGEAIEALRQQLGGGTVRDPDENGFFEAQVAGGSWDAAAANLRGAIAAAGAEEAIELGEPSGRVQGE